MFLPPLPTGAVPHVSPPDEAVGMWPPCTQPPIWLCRPHLHCQGDRHFIPPTWDDAGHTQPCGSWSLSSDGLPSYGSHVPCPLFCLMKRCEEGSWAGAGSRCPQRCWGVGDVAVAVGRSPPAGEDVACPEYWALGPLRHSTQRLQPSRCWPSCGAVRQHP